MESVRMPNPNTSLAFLPPETANQIEATRYLYVALAAGYVSHLFSSASEDWKLLTRYPFNMSAAMYFISRAGTVGLIVSDVVFQIASVSDCHAAGLAISSSMVVVITSSTFLFLFRARAVFFHIPWATTFFAFLWIASAGLSIMIPIGVDCSPIADSRRCLVSSVQTYVSGAAIALALHDTILFVAISWGLISHRVRGFKDFVRVFFYGEDLPAVTKILFRGGQQYYFVVVAFNLVIAVLILVPSVPPFIRSLLASPDVVLTNTMACTVYRKTKLGILSDDTPSAMPLSDIRFRETLGGTSNATQQRAHDIELGVKPALDANGESFFQSTRSFGGSERSLSWTKPVGSHQYITDMV